MSDEAGNGAGSVTRRFESLWWKPQYAITALVFSTLFGGGGLASFKAIGDKLDIQTAKLTELAITVTEIRTRVAASDVAATKADMAIGAIAEKIGSLERQVTRASTRIEDQDRRLSALEGKK